MLEPRKILRHALLSIVSLLVYLLLNRPEVIVISHLGAVVWYPATGLVLALMLGISPWYAIIAAIGGSLAGILFYGQPIITFSQTIGAIGISAVYAAAAYVLRGPLRIDFGLHRRRDVVLYVSVTTVAALSATAVGVACLAADHAIRWSEFWQSASEWFLGDEIGLLAVAPFLLIRVFPWVRRQLLLGSAETLSEMSHPGETTSLVWKVLELGGQTLALVLSLWTLVGTPFLQFQAPFICFVPIIWIAMRQGIQRTVSGLLALNFGIVVVLHFAPPTAALLPKYGLLMFVVSATGLIVGSAVTERHRLAVELLQRSSELLSANTEMNAAKHRAEEASRIKSEFLANMSHEIRTPVNGIVGLTELALKTELTSEQREYLVMLKSSGDSLLVLINDILDFSKIESGKLELDPVEFNLRDVIEETLRGLALGAHEKGLELACGVDPLLPEYLIGDSGRLRQVLYNLIGNALRFTSKGEVIVRVEPVLCGDREIELQFSVNDTGIGIPPEKHSVIFNAFTQADGTTTRNYGGTGLGLTISSRLVGLMGGRIWLESAVGKGSTFYFTVTCHIPEGSRAARSATQHSALVQVPVLLVDDNASQLGILAEVTKSWGMIPVAVEGGPAALKAIEEAVARGASFSLAIIDGDMPGMDGFALAERITGNPRWTAPIIMTVTSIQRGNAEQLSGKKIAGSLLKPLKHSELLSCILASLGFPSSDPARTIAAHSAPVKVSRQLRVLVAEDNRVNQVVAVRMLETMGHLPVVANNGREALEMMESETFDLICMDVQMPQMDGLTATRKIREKEGQTGSHIPIIAMTAHAVKGDREKCFEAGMDGYVSKPVTIRGIADAIAEFFPEEDRVDLALPSPPPFASGWSRSRLVQMLDGDESLARELVEIFLEEGPKQLENLRRAIETEDQQEVERISHGLKSELGYLGLKDAAEKAKELERIGREATLQSAAQLFTALETDMLAALATMQNTLQHGGSRSAWQ